jgi:hypothetical protein
VANNPTRVPSDTQHTTNLTNIKPAKQEALERQRAVAARLDAPPRPSESADPSAAAGSSGGAPADEQRRLAVAAAAAAAAGESGSSVTLVCPGNPKVDFVAWVPVSPAQPGQAAGSGGGTLWVSAGHRVFFFDQGSSKHKTELALPPRVRAVFGLLCRRCHQVCSLLSLFQQGLSHPPPTTPNSKTITPQSPMTAIAFGDSSTIWTGHGDGIVRAHHKGAWDTVQIPACRTAIRALALDCKGQAWVGDEVGQIKALRFDPRSRGVSVIWQALPDGPPVPGACACVGLISRGALMMSAGGRARGALTLWDTNKFATSAGLDVAAYGGMTCLQLLPWSSEEEGGNSSGGGGCGDEWRLLSGQSNGQVLLWEVEAGRLRLVTAIGKPTGGSVK